MNKDITHYRHCQIQFRELRRLTNSLTMLALLWQIHPFVRVQLFLNCETLPDVESANVVGEIRGAEKPNEVIVIGGHLDSWDKGQGAHDDGAGCVQSIEALRLLKEVGLKPKRTIRCVLFMNESNLKSLNKSRCHSERSEESQFLLYNQEILQSLRSFRMTNWAF